MSRSKLALIKLAKIWSSSSHGRRRGHAVFLLLGRTIIDCTRGTCKSDRRSEMKNIFQTWNNDTQIKTTAIRCSMDQSSSSQAHAGGTESPSPISRPSLSPEDPPYFPPAACRRRRPPTPPRLYCIAYRRRDATPGERTGDTAARAARLGARADATRRETRFVACEVQLRGPPNAAGETTVHPSRHVPARAHRASRPCPAQPRQAGPVGTRR
jgi:hypothetical protein